MLFRLFNKLHIVAIITFIFYMIFSFMFFKNDPSFWWAFALITIAFMLLFTGLFISLKMPSLSFIPMIDKPVFTFYWVELGYGVLIQILIHALKDGQLNPLINLIQIPIILVIAAWIATVLIKAKHIGGQLKEEQQTVAMRQAYIAMIDKAAAASYGYKVSDSVSALSMKLRTMSLGERPEDREIIDNINILNSYMRAKRPEQEVVSQMVLVETLVESRRR